MNDNVVYLKDHKAPHGPGAMAITRDQAGGDLRAAVLLYRIKHFFDPKNNFKKLERFGRQWIAMPREQWAFEAGLNRSNGELRTSQLNVKKRQNCFGLA